MTWQLIASAPQDRIILIGFAPHPHLNGGRRVFEARWDARQQTWTSVNGFIMYTGATHWRPLPEAPEAAP